MTDIPQSREPFIFAIGDTLYFKRYLPGYLPSGGWTLLYEIRGGTQAGAAVISFNSATVDSHFEMTVAAAVSELWQPGDYVLAGYAVNGTIRHQIYYAELTLTPNLGSNANDADVTTHAQRMVRLIQSALETLAANSLIETSVERTTIIRERRKELQYQLALNQEIRRGEIAQENLRNGRPSGNKIVPVFNVTGPGCAYGTGVITR